MASESQRWLIKSTQGKISGPFSTAEIMEKIRTGEVTEEDSIAAFPGSNWYPVSHNPEFYDYMLKVLSAEHPDDVSVYRPPMSEDDEPLEPDESLAGKSKSHFSQSATTPIEKDPFGDQSEAGAGSRTEEVLEPEDEFQNIDHDPIQKSKGPKKRQARASEKTNINVQSQSGSGGGSDDVIELSPMEEVIKEEKEKKRRWPMLIIIATVGVLLFIITTPPKTDISEKIHLISPTSERKLDDATLRKKYETGQKTYVANTFKFAVRAQNEFVQIIEAQPKNVRAMAMLCLAYLDLWPYTYKDQKDKKAVNDVLVMAKSIDPVGANGNTCEVVNHLINENYEKAKNVIDGVLNMFESSNEPPIVFYYFKALSLEQEKNYTSALGYATSAQRLWPQWLHAYVLEAHLQEQTGNTVAAATRLNQVVKVNPKHKIALLKSGLLEYGSFFRYEIAKKVLKNGLAIKDKAPPKLVSNAYMALSEMALKENNSKDALRFAQQSFKAYPANQKAKNLVLQMGGKKDLPKGEEDALVFEGEQFARQGDYNAAQAHFKAAYEKNPKNGLAAMKAGVALWKMSFSTEAISWLNKAVKANPKLIEAYIILADYYSQRYSFEEAGTILRKANRIAPKNYEIYRGYAIVQFRQRNYLGAVGFCKQALKIYEADSETLILLAESQYELRNYSEAYNAANKAIELDPNNREAHIIFAKTLAGVQGIDAGIQYLGRLIEQFPLVADYRMAMAKILFEDEQYSSAEEIYVQVTEIVEKPKEAYIELGKIYRIQELYEQARKIFLDAASLDPADPDPLYELGVLLLEVKKHRDAEQQFVRVKNINPRFPLVNYNIGRAALMSRDYKRAVQMALEEQKLNPNLTESYLLGAEAYAKMGNFKLCAREYQKAIQLMDQPAIIYVQLASCYRRSGNLDIAEKMLNRASSKESGLPDIYRELGQIFEMKGNYNRAIESYSQYLALFPSAPDSAQVKKQIEKIESY